MTALNPCMNVLDPFWYSVHERFSPNAVVLMRNRQGGMSD